MSEGDKYSLKGHEKPAFLTALFTITVNLCTLDMKTQQYNHNFSNILALTVTWENIAFLLVQRST